MCCWTTHIATATARSKVTVRNAIDTIAIDVPGSVCDPGRRYPLALVAGLGMSPALSTRFRRISSLFSIQFARSVHFLVFCWFVVFIIAHVTMVITTRA